MLKAIIKLTSIDDVKDFVRKANELSYDVDLSLGKYTVDAKSIMGIFSLDLSREIELTVHSDDEEFFGRIEDNVIRRL